MVRKWMFPVISFALILLGSIILVSDGAEEISFIQMNFENDDGGLTHGGTGDHWEWGSPGSYMKDNPGPDGAGEGIKAWGCPLNGTYPVSTDSYLALPEFDAVQASTLTISFLCWYDLSITEDERNGTGPSEISDECYLEARVDNGDWVRVRIFNGSSGGSWVQEDIDLSGYLSGELDLRFRLVDNGDSFMDNGFFLDMVRMWGEERPEVSVSLGSKAYIPPLVASIEMVGIEYYIINDGKTVPPASYVSVYIETIGGEPEFYTSNEVSPTTSGKRTVEWYPSGKGSFRGWINLTVGGVYQEGRSFNIRSYTPVYYDDASSGTSHMTVQDGIAEAKWTTIQPPLDGFSMSGEKVFWYGSPNGGPNGTAGFEGPTWAYLETDWIDLNYYTNSLLYIYHSYSFLGPRGSSGGVVEAYNQEGGWTVLDATDLSYGKLRENISGPLGGSEAIVGTDDWGHQGFDLGSFVGGRTRIRLSVVADAQGWGEGWFIDDIMVVGEGYDPYDSEPPAPIEGLDVEIVDEGAVTLSWYSSNARDFSAYNVYIEEFDFEDIIGLVPEMELEDEEQTSIVITDLDPEKEYWIAVTAVDVVGNEDPDVETKYFIPSTSGENRRPIADIKIVGGGFARSVGEDITFDGTGSVDPDGDPLTYIWTMPDGKIFRGEKAIWSSDEAGEDQLVTLEVKDNNGLTDLETITIDILEDESPIDKGKIWPFLITVIPLILIILVVVIAAYAFRNRSKGRLEKRLKKIGIKMDGTFTTQTDEPQAHQTTGPKGRPSSPKVHDVVAVKKQEKEERKDIEEVSHRKGPIKQRPESKPGDKHEKLHYHPPPLVKVVIECPFCSEIFKEKVDPNLIKERQVFTVKCPHCGRGGDITP